MSDKGLKPVAVILGLGTNGLAVARSLGRHRVPIIILEEQKCRNQPHLKTKYGQKVLIDNTIGSPLLEALESIQQGAVLFPTTDRQVEWLSRNRNRLPGQVKTMLPADNVVWKMMDKKEFFAFCQENELLLPRFKLVQANQDPVAMSSDLRLPLIIKTPQKAYVKNLAKAYIVHDVEELSRLWGHISKLYPEFIIQEFIEGGDRDVYFCMQYISKDGKLLASFSGRKLRQWTPLCGGTASCEPVDGEILREMTYKIFRTAGFHGLGSMEYKLDNRNGKFYIVEPTACRTDFQEQVAISNGVDIPFIAYCDTCGVDVEPRVGGCGNRAWMHIRHDYLAADYYIRKKELTRRQWLRSLLKMGSFDLLSIDDPMPAVDSLSKWVARKIKAI